MTRIARYRKTHLPATGFEEMLASGGGTVAERKSTAENNEDRKRKRETENVSESRQEMHNDAGDDGIYGVAEDVTGGEENAENGHARKRGRSRHRAKLDAAAEKAAKEAAEKAPQLNENGVPTFVSKLPYSKDPAIRSEARRLKRIAKRHAETVCYVCRQPGHPAKECTMAPSELRGSEASMVSGSASICFRCGSTEHRVQLCRRKPNKANPYPYAHCFICNQQGHLSSACEQNEKGLYPNGGSCVHCGSVRHLARDCEKDKKDKDEKADDDEDGEEAEEAETPKKVPMGGDDDDVTFEMHVQSKKKPKKTAQKKKEDNLREERPAPAKRLPRPAPAALISVSDSNGGPPQRPGSWEEVADRMDATGGWSGGVRAGVVKKTAVAKSKKVVRF
ncbi:hypothetical protein BJ742DRAFT_802530 [Cladochytrium replicatum]|nr:hypothetical protein BJ742DRAFT_802530 [Cladochytrium replicatum]